MLALLCATGLVALGSVAEQSLADAQKDLASSSSEGLRLMQARCAVCHSLDLITQQRLDRSRWEATVAKMVHWGAQLSAEEQKMLTDFLAEQYSPDAPDTSSVETGRGVPQETAGDAVPLAATHPQGHVRRGKGLYAHNCLPCHGQGATGGVGPKLAAMPLLADESRFWETVSRGRGAMPAWGGTLAEQEIADIHAWLGSLR